MSETATGNRPVLQKLLTHGLGTAIVDDGYDQVGGIVVLAGDAVPLDTPDKLLGAYGFDVTGQEFVDVVRFELPPLAILANPVAPGADRDPLYPTGFLTGRVLRGHDLVCGRPSARP